MGGDTRVLPRVFYRLTYPDECWVLSLLGSLRSSVSSFMLYQEVYHIALTCNCQDWEIWHSLNSCRGLRSNLSGGSDSRPYWLLRWLRSLLANMTPSKRSEKLKSSCNWKARSIPVVHTAAHSSSDGDLAAHYPAQKHLVAQRGSRYLPGYKLASF